MWFPTPSPLFNHYWPQFLSASIKRLHKKWLSLSSVSLWKHWPLGLNLDGTGRIYNSFCFFNGWLCSSHVYILCCGEFWFPASCQNFINKAQFYIKWPENSRKWIAVKENVLYSMRQYIPPLGVARGQKYVNRLDYVIHSFCKSQGYKKFYKM